ncbi:TPA: hypothetical protein ACJGLG_004869 [Salmonella enterica subsp. enterica serovar Typhimurium]
MENPSKTQMVGRMVGKTARKTSRDTDYKDDSTAYDNDENYAN